MSQRIIVAFGGAEIIVGAAFQLWPNVMPAWLSYLVIGIGGMTVFYAALGMRGPLSILPSNNEHVWLPNWKISSINLKSLPFRRLISMRRAAKIAYQKIQGTKHADMAERTARETKTGSDGILEYYAWALVGRGDEMEMWGRRPPSTRLQAIDGAKECPQCAFVDGGNSLKRYNDLDPRWTDVMVAKSQLRKRIKHIAEYG